MKLLDYLFYGFYSFYKNRSDIPVYMSCICVGLILFGSLLSIYTITSMFMGILQFSKLYWVFVILLLLLILYSIYSNKSKVIQLENRYAGEGEAKKELRGVVIVIVGFLLLLFPVLIGVLRNNLGYKI